MLVQRWSPQLKNRGCDTVLRGQGYLTPQGAVVDGYGTMVEWWLKGENQRTLEQNLLQCHSFHHESHIESTGIEPEALRWELY
jgi:hypothetical protein